MLGINKAPISLAMRSVFLRVLVSLNAKQLGRGEIIAVIFQNPLLLPDGNANPVVVAIGEGGGQPWQLLPGQESPIIYAEDLKDIYLKINSGATETEINCLIYTKPDSALVKG